ncbi:thioredoxin [Klebsiella phage vB_KpnM-VAC36]|nr:thioredoxin [Klebsiella phage vB_KpnM-VAC36]WLJ70046.1 hypothetical protein BM7_CDS0117 [Klebsiella phage Kpn BM7]
MVFVGVHQIENSRKSLFRVPSLWDLYSGK